MATLTATPAPATTPALVDRGRTIAAFVRGMARAQQEKLLGYKHIVNGTWDGVSYEITSATQPGRWVTRWNGGDWTNISCPCPARGICKHMAITAWCRRWHATAVLPRCEPCNDLFCPGGCEDAPKAEPEPVRELERSCLLCGKPERHGERCPDCYRAPIRRCVTCGTDPALADNEQCVGCASVYPDGQDAAERLELERSLHPVTRPADPCHERQVALGRSRITHHAGSVGH